MASEVSICNDALQSVGTRSSIAALTESSPEARTCNQVYASTRDEVAGMAFWNFARKTATFSLLKSAPGTPSNPVVSTLVWSTAYPAPPWLYEYSYPSDCIQCRMIVPQINTAVAGVPLMTGPVQMYPYLNGPAVPFMVASDLDDQGTQINVVLTNQYQAIGVYTCRTTNPNLFGAQYCRALSAAIGARIAMQLTGDKVLMNSLYAQANAFITQARATDGNEGLTVIDQQAEWIMARESIAYAGYGLGNFVAPYGPLFPVF